jgi:hypothetical protein
MPHIQLDSGQTVDLELEVHSKMKPDDFVNYIKDWADSKPVTSRNRSIPFKIDPKSVPDFAKAVRSSEWFKMFTKRFYGQEIWVLIDNFLKSKE